MSGESESNDGPSLELLERIALLRSVLTQHTELVNALIAVCVQHESAQGIRQEEQPVPPAVSSALVPLLLAVGSSTNTVLSLSDKPGLQTRDCYSVARSIVEGCIKLCFIMAEGASAADKAVRHARQKAFRDMARYSQVADSVLQLRYLGAPDPAQIDRLEEEMAEFQSRSGRETDWTSLSVDKRIEVAGDKLGEQVLHALHAARFAVYRHSSEILHGTVFGALYFMGRTSPNPARFHVEFHEQLGHQHMMVLLAAAAALSAVVEGFDSAYGLKTARDRSKELLSELSTLPYHRGTR